MPHILSAAKKWGAEYEIHRTSGPGEATTYVKNRIASGEGETMRFYSCGGDGTAAEVLAGLYGAGNAELAIIPAGSGNDYVRNFGGKERFRDITAQLAGTAVPVDVMQVTYTPAHPKTGVESDELTFFAINMVNMGFDAKAVGHMTRLKNKFFIKGTGAYIAGVLRELASFKMSRAVFRPAGKDEFEADFLLGGVGSGRFSGGGFDGIPPAIVNDGLLDLLVIDPLTRGEFLRLVGIYHDGKHMEHPGLASKHIMIRTESVEIEPSGGLIFTTDGEVRYTNKMFKVFIAPEKAQFVMPDGVAHP